MDIRDQILKALTKRFTIDYARLDNGERVSGFVVSPQFRTLSALDRQRLIDDALNQASELLPQEQRRRILMIAALTPEEYAAVGVPVRIQRVRETAGGGVEIVLQGNVSDAEYVRGRLLHEKGVQTTEPKQVSSIAGTLTRFRAKGTVVSPLTKAKALRLLKNDRSIEVMPNA